MATQDPVLQEKRPGISYASSIRSLIVFLRNPVHKNASSEPIEITNTFSVLYPPGEDDTYDQSDVRTCVGPHQNVSNDVRTCVGPHQNTVNDVCTCVGPHLATKNKLKKMCAPVWGLIKILQMMCAPVWGLINHKNKTMCAPVWGLIIMGS